MLEIQNLSVVYSNGVEALSDVNLQLNAGSIYGIIGPNGAGKTTFVKGILGIVPAHGKVTYKGKSIKSWAKQTAYVEQKKNLDLDFPISVLDCVLLGTYPKLRFFEKPGATEKAAARKAIQQVGLTDQENRQIGELSGGQFQRVLIARTIVQDADLIFLDEPFVGVDVNSEAIIIDLLKQLVAEGKTIFMVHHDLSKVRDYFEKVILINKKVIAHGPTEKAFTKENLIKTFDVLDNPLFT
ncbi:MAG TPA: metal ABC transporter ATP-binding protein [Flavobacteriaceae bacterium]|nr:metal ABC transporter ATP-binding protein [Flavobacteriaceae bacterium]